MFYTKQIVTKQNLSIRAEDPNSKGKEKPRGLGRGNRWWWWRWWEGKRLKIMMTEITINWLRLSVKADALVAEPTRMLGTGRGWCLLPERQSPTASICLPRP